MQSDRDVICYQHVHQYCCFRYELARNEALSEQIDGIIHDGSSTLEERTRRAMMMMAVVVMVMSFRAGLIRIFSMALREKSEEVTMRNSLH